MKISFKNYNISPIFYKKKALNKQTIKDKNSPLIQNYTDFSVSNINFARKPKYNLDFLYRKVNSIEDNKKQCIFGNLDELIDIAKKKNGDKVTEKILSDEIFYNNPSFMRNLSELARYLNTMEYNATYDINVLLDLMDEIIKNKDIERTSPVYNMLHAILTSTANESQSKVAKRILSDKRLFNNEDFMYYASDIIFSSFETDYANIKINLLDKITSDEKYYNNAILMNYIGEIIEEVSDREGEKIANKILSDEKFYNNDAFLNQNILKDYNIDDDAEKILSLMDEEGITPMQIVYCLDLNADIDVEELKKLNKLLGINKTGKLSLEDTKIASKLTELYGLNEVSQIPISERRKILKTIIDFNFNLFNVSNTVKLYFPLIPINKGEYCSTINELVKLINVEPDKLSDKEIKDFYITLSKLSSYLSKMKDADFNNLTISQKYSKDDFIKDISDELKYLSEENKRKIYNHFNFELTPNERSKTFFSIEGYPTVPKDKEIDDDLKQCTDTIANYINKFNKDNKIKTNNIKISEYLNRILNIFPELRLLIGKVQAGNVVNGRYIGAGSHDFDVFKHSLKVMQKISQDPKFNKLPDDNILLLASLFHDITKSEGYITPNHPEKGAFDTYFITKKLGLDSKSEYKLYTLIKNHEWLGYINRFKNENDLDRRLKSVAYNLRYDDMLDLCLIFCHADLKAVKADNSFHDKTTGSSRRFIDGKQRSFGEAAKIYGNKLKKLITELQKTQPLLPTTKFPKASTINKAITNVNPDGSTNIKGVYKDKDGLIVINYNEVENEAWEKIGFSKGTISKGIKFSTNLSRKVNTGNFKFFVHGLDYAEQLANFEAFGLIDSEALLSVSYAERPESKFRFFRPQGLILETKSQNVHGGGKTDTGSGTKKTIEDFKEHYTFEGYRSQEREYVSNLIKNTIWQAAADYRTFVKNNENKELSEITPSDISHAMVKTLGTINSNTRKGERNYNEFYISNPKVMAVYAYSYLVSENIKNPIEFLNRKQEAVNFSNNPNITTRISPKSRTGFLRRYALEHDIPFVVFSR